MPCVSNHILRIRVFPRRWRQRSVSVRAELIFIHMSHHAGLHAELEKQLSPDVHLTFDGMEIEF